MQIATTTLSVCCCSYNLDSNIVTWVLLLFYLQRRTLFIDNEGLAKFLSTAKYSSGMEKFTTPKWQIMMLSQQDI